jgi:hypothetical protein
MKKLLIVLAFLGFASTVHAAQPGPAARERWRNTFTTDGYLGPWPSAAAPFSCDSTKARAEYYDTANNIYYVCDGTAWRKVVLQGSTGTAASIVNADISASAAISRSKLAEDALAPFPVPLEAIKSNAGAALTAAETAGTFDITVGTNTLVANGEVTDNETEVSVAYFQFMLPAEYVAGGDVTIRMPAALIKTGSPTNNGSTLDIEVFEQTNATAGSDICATAAVTFAALDTWYNKDFTITATDLVAGDVITVKVTSSVVDSEAGGGTIILNLAPPTVLVDIKG